MKSKLELQLIIQATLADLIFFQTISFESIIQLQFEKFKIAQTNFIPSPRCLMKFQRFIGLNQVDIKSMFKNGKGETQRVVFF
ncbi:unnamed protein product [Paramecium octaurelia]|uniref:Uncharacterized protein n=1 Tax=Paramecium octaurelia TaxID=43137 RepID=A0A8S1T3N2_PAROT|nr:unnamed protein product [Paramecium octaurelia]